MSVGIFEEKNLEKWKKWRVFFKSFFQFSDLDIFFLSKIKYRKKLFKKTCQNATHSIIVTKVKNRFKIMLSFYALAIFWPNGNKKIKKDKLREGNKGNKKNRKNRKLIF